MTNPDYDAESCNEDEKITENETKEQPLDAYITTGVYIEEEKEYGDLLIVLGEDFLPSHLRQFYITSNNDKIFTRILSKSTWSSWFVVQHEDSSETRLDFNDSKEAALIKTQKIVEYVNAPEGFEAANANSENILICLTLDESHIVQFLIGHTKRHFWIRHCADEVWSSWETFI